MIKKCSFIIVLSFFCLGMVQAQTSEDMLLIGKKLNHPDHVPKEQLSPKHSWYQLVNPLYWVYKGAISFMDHHIADPMSYRCYFEHSCGHFRKELTGELGPVRAVLLTIDRQARCTRISVAESSRQKLTASGKIKDNVHNYRVK